MKKRNITLVLLLCILLQTLSFAQEVKNALLIANCEYGKDIGVLSEPIPEAHNLQIALESIGFDVVVVENADREKMGLALQTFKEKCKKEGGIAFFHYGGHAVQIDGVNYLLPSNTQLDGVSAVRYRCIEVNEVMENMQGDANIIILDSCRNNPFSSSTRGANTRGLAAVTRKPLNSIIVYSAAAGDTAQDGVFTPILTKRITESNKNFYDILQEVRRDVHVATNGKQKPGSYDELMAPVYLAGLDAKEPITTDIVDLSSIIPKTSEIYEDETYTLNGVKFIMKYIEAVQDALLGSSIFDDNREHKVHLSGYYIGETEVTQELWQVVMGNNPSKHKKSNQNPVECVSWFDSVVFCNELTIQTMGKEHCVYKIVGSSVTADFSKKGFRLPTEAEWEYAALGGRPYQWAGTNSNANIKKYAWYGDNSKSCSQKVKTKLPNAYELYDMSGNVQEWCWDWYGSGYYLLSRVQDPSGAKQGQWRIVRGGAFLVKSKNIYCLQCSYRSSSDPKVSNSFTGFRLARHP